MPCQQQLTQYIQHAHVDYYTLHAQVDFYTLHAHVDFYTQHAHLDFYTQHAHVDFYTLQSTQHKNGPTVARCTHAYMKSRVHASFCTRAPQTHARRKSTHHPSVRMVRMWAHAHTRTEQEIKSRGPPRQWPERRQGPVRHRPRVLRRIQNERMGIIDVGDEEAAASVPPPPLARAPPVSLQRTLERARAVHRPVARVQEHVRVHVHDGAPVGGAGAPAPRLLAGGECPVLTRSVAVAGPSDDGRARVQRVLPDVEAHVLLGRLDAEHGETAWLSMQQYAE